MYQRHPPHGRRRRGGERSPGPSSTGSSLCCPHRACHPRIASGHKGAPPGHPTLPLSTGSHPQSSRKGTPWQHLYESRSDDAFIAVLSIDVDTFFLILTSGFAALWDSTAIPRTDTNAVSVPRIARRSPDAAGALALTLHHVRFPFETRINQ